MSRVRFRDDQLFREQRFTTDTDSQTGERYLLIPVANRLVDYLERHRLTPEQHGWFATDVAAAAAFADKCRARAHDDLLILQPGRDRGQLW